VALAAGLVSLAVSLVPGLLTPNAARDAQVAAVVGGLVGFGLLVGKFVISSPIFIPVTFWFLNRIGGNWWDIHRPQWWADYLEHDRARVEAKKRGSGQGPNNPPAPAP
jgi:hypothetical protein